MAKRDPNKTARNKLIKIIKDELDLILPSVLFEMNIENQASLNGLIGSKADKFIDLKNEIILSYDEYVLKWLEGLKTIAQKHKTRGYKSQYVLIYDKLQNNYNVKKYVLLFLRRSYLCHYEELAKKRPHETESEIWLGQNNASSQKSVPFKGLL